MENAIVVAGLIFLSTLVFTVWLVNRQNKVLALDLSKIGLYLVERRKVFTQFQGHSAVFDPISFISFGCV